MCAHLGRGQQATASHDTPPARPPTPQVSDAQRSFRETVNSYLARTGAAGADVEGYLARREAEARERGDEPTASLYALAAAKSQAQSQAVAWSLRAAAEEAGPGASIVAVVNLGTMASLQRNWGEAMPPEVRRGRGGAVEGRGRGHAAGVEGRPRGRKGGWGEVMPPGERRAV